MADTATADPVVATVTPSAPAEPVTTEPTSVVDHAERYGPNGSGAPAGPDDDDGPLDDVVDDAQRPRGSRAQSKKAAARINKLSTELYELRQWKASQEAKQQKAAEPKPTPVYRPAPAPTVEFTEPEPTLEQFADKDDPYGAWQRELARYDRRKEAADAQQSHMQAQQQQQSKQAREQWGRDVTAHQQRLIAAVSSNPAHYQALASADQRWMPQVLEEAIVLDNQSADVALFLATHTSELDEFVVKAAALPANDESVALLRRLLRQRMSAGTTGSVAPSPVIPNAPRPPNPVRTGTIRTGGPPPTDGTLSVLAHAKTFKRS